MKNKCLCGSEQFYISKVGQHNGMYCSVCGAWYKWADKNEVRLYTHSTDDSVELKIKYIRDIPLLTVIDEGDWIDLYCGTDVTIKKGEYTLIPLGIAIELPKGYEAIIAPRSSTFKRYGLIQVNSIGIIDESFNGDGDEWCLPVINLMEDVTVKRGTRICQFRLFKHQPECKFIKVSSLGNSDRGGFGGTGV